MTFLKILKSFPIFCSSLICYLIYLISGIIPRDKKVWVFGSWKDSLVDNSKYFFYYVSENHPEIECIWISGNKTIINELLKTGYKALNRFSLKGFLKCLRAGIYIYNSNPVDINFWTSKGAVLFNLWHGIPLKKIENDIKTGKYKNKYNSWQKYLYKIGCPYIYKKPDLLLSTSPFVTNLFLSAFKIKANVCLELGYPRCDLFFLKKDEIESIISQREPYLDYIIKQLEKFSYKLIYLPTFREMDTFNLMEIIDIDELNKELINLNGLMIIKYHPSIKTAKNLSYSNIIILPSSIDIYPILPFTDLLITDYSSVMFDYLLLDKPIIFYPYDKQRYEKQERGFYFSYDDFTPGPKIKKSEELVPELKNILINKLDEYSYKRKEIRDLLFLFNDGNSSERIYFALINKIKKEII